MKFLISFILLFVVSSINDLKIHSVIDIKAEQIYSDTFDNVYIISGNQFIKYNSNGKRTALYDSRLNEKISFADVSDPMKILLFFKDQNVIRFVDNNLSPAGNEIYPENKSVYGDVSICVSNTGGFWLTDNTSDKLIKFNFFAKREFEKDLFTLKGNPEFIISNNKALFIKTDNNDTFVFDNLGNFNFKLNKKIPSDFSVEGNTMRYFNKKEQIFVSYNIETEDSSYIKLPADISVLNAIQSTHYLIFNDSKKVYFSEIH